MRPRLRKHRDLVATMVLALLLAMATVSVASGPALGQVDRLRIDRVDLEPDGTSRVVFTAPPAVGPVTADQVRLFEDGEPVRGLRLSVLTERVEAARLSLVMAIDVSGSTAGAALDAAKQAAHFLVEDLVERGVEVAVIAFADDARLLVGPTVDVGVLQQAIDSLEAGGDTALNDAVLLAARTLVGVDGEHRLLLFTDGRDDGSTTSLQLATEAVAFTELPVQSIVLETADTDVAALDVLAGVAGGSVNAVADAEGLASAFETVARELPSVHEATWTSQRRSDELALRLEVGLAADAVVDEALVLNPRVGSPTSPRIVSSPEPGVLAAADGALALGLLGLGLAAILATLFAPRPERAVARSLHAAGGEGPLTRKEREQDRRDDREDGGGLSLRVRATRRAATYADALPRPSGYDDGLVRRLERAGWSLRPGEFQVARLAAAAGSFVVAAGLAQNLVAGGFAGLLGFLAPGAMVERAHDKRHDAFVEQLPDVLQLLAGSLKAGYGLVQAMDLVVEESQEPISTEFRRVLNEHLLGLELEDALDAMAKRIDSEDLKWVVVAMNIQRRVGGNLAQLLDIVATTLRDRQSVRRHVQGLSAEGRLSARILTAMPFLIGGYVGIVNPDYIGLLFTDPRGQVMLVGALLGMVVGTWWMRRLVDIDI